MIQPADIIYLGVQADVANQHAYRATDPSTGDVVTVGSADPITLDAAADLINEALEGRPQ